MPTTAAIALRHRQELEADALAVRWLIETKNIGAVDDIVDLLLAWAALDGDASDATHPSPLARARVIKLYKGEVLLLRLQRYRGFGDEVRDRVLQTFKKEVAAMLPPAFESPVRELDLVRSGPTRKPIADNPTKNDFSLKRGTFVDERVEWLRRAIGVSMIGFVSDDPANPLTRPDPDTYSFRYDEKYPESDVQGIIRGAANGTRTELRVEIAFGSRQFDVYPKLERLMLAINSIANAEKDWKIHGWDESGVYTASDEKHGARIEVTSQFIATRREYVVEFLLTKTR